MYFYANTGYSEYFCEDCASPQGCRHCGEYTSSEYDIAVYVCDTDDYPNKENPLGIECSGCGFWLVEPDSEYCGECEESPCECEPDEDSDPGEEIIYICKCCTHDPCYTLSCIKRVPKTDKKEPERPIGSVNLEDYLEDD